MFENISNTGQILIISFACLLVLVLILIIVFLARKVKKNNKREDSFLDDNDFIVQKEEVKEPVIEVQKEEVKPVENKFDISTVAKKIEQTLEDDNIDLTMYEMEQEEKSIISYEELKNSVDSKKNIKVPTPIKKEEEFNTEVLDFTNEIKINNTNFDNKYKPSEFVSPINGIDKKKYIADMPNFDNIDSNIKHSNEFLDALKELKSNLE